MALPLYPPRRLCIGGLRDIRASAVGRMATAMEWTKTDELMMARARNARLCGSGSAVFGVTLNQAEAEETARMMRLKYSRVFVCRAVPRAESLAFEASLQ